MAQLELVVPFTRRNTEKDRAITKQSVDSGLGTAFVTLVLVDGRYSLIEANQQGRFQLSGGVEFANPDFVALARAFGLPGYRVERADDLLPTLRRALDEPGPALVAVPTDPRENRKLGDDLYGQS